MGRGRRAAKSQRCTGFSLLLLLRLFLRLLPPPPPQPSPPPPAAQIPAQSQRPRRCGRCCCCCRCPRTRPLQPPFGPISAGGESGFSTRNATRQPGELGTRQRDRLIPAPRSSRQGRRGEDEGGRRNGGRLGKESGKTYLPREALPLQLLLPSSLLLGELPRAPTKTSGGVWLCAPAPSDRAAVSLGGEKHVTEPLRSAAWPPPPPGGSRPGLYIPGRARPAPAPLRPAAVPQRRPRPASAQRSGSAPMRPPALAQSLPPRAPPRAPPARRNPRRGRRRGCLGGYPKARGESGKTRGGELGKTQERGWGATGGHCGFRAQRRRARGGGGARAGLDLT